MNSARVRAMGMVSALGHDVVSACAAARAGLSRAVELEGPEAELDPAGGPDPVRGHAVRASAFGFQGRGRLEALLHPALDDLLARAALADGEAPDGLYLAFGDRTRYGGPEGAAANERLGEALLEVVEARLGASFAVERRLALPADRSGFAHVLARALRDLGAGKVRRPLVGVVDSLVDEQAVAWLLEAGRLKTSLQPVGTSPGEGAAFFSLDEEPGGVRLSEPAFGAPQDSPGATLAALLAGLGGVQEAAGWVVTDQNGEADRAHEWGTALVRSASAVPALRECEPWYPVAEFGDTAAASGAIHCATMVRALERGYAPRPSGVLLSLDDDGSASALTVRGGTHGT